jgi:hypothetical protein
MTAIEQNKVESVNAENLRSTIARQTGLTVTAFAARIGYARGYVYMAVRWPDRHPIAHKRILEELNK